MNIMKGMKVIWVLIYEADLTECLSPTGTLAKSVGHFIDEWLIWEGITHSGSCQPCAGGPWLYKTSGWTNYESKASRQCSSISPSLLVPVFSSLNSQDDGMQLLRSNSSLPSIHLSSFLTALLQILCSYMISTLHSFIVKEQRKA